MRVNMPISSANVLILSTIIPIMVAGCATAPEVLPICEKFVAYGVMSEKGPGVFFDEENALILRNMLLGLSERKCRLDADNAAKTPNT